jgi:hypothetical protein
VVFIAGHVLPAAVVRRAGALAQRSAVVARPPRAGQAEARALADALRAPVDFDRTRTPSAGVHPPGERGHVARVLGDLHQHEGAPVGPHRPRNPLFGRAAAAALTHDLVVDAAP